MSSVWIVWHFLCRRRDLEVARGEVWSRWSVIVRGMISPAIVLFFHWIPTWKSAERKKHPSVFQRRSSVPIQKKVPWGIFSFSIYRFYAFSLLLYPGHHHRHDNSERCYHIVVHQTRCDVRYARQSSAPNSRSREERRYDSEQTDRGAIAWLQLHSRPVYRAG